MKVGGKPRGLAVKLPRKGRDGGAAADGGGSDGLTALQKLQAEEEERKRFAEEYRLREESEERRKQKEQERQARKDSASSSRSSSSSSASSRTPTRPKRFSVGPRPRVFLEVEVRLRPQPTAEDGALEARGRMEFELFADLVPRTAENFRQLCTGERGQGLHYRGCMFHRIIPGFMAQAGDITTGDGRGGCSIYGKAFEDENFMEKHSCPGVLAMANSGPNTNNSQFFIIFQAQPHLNGKHVVFGKLIADPNGLLACLERAGTPEGQPRRLARISDCGQVQVLGWGPPTSRWPGSSSPRRLRPRCSSSSSSSSSRAGKGRRKRSASSSRSRRRRSSSSSSITGRPRPKRGRKK